MRKTGNAVPAQKYKKPITQRVGFWAFLFLLPTILGFIVFVIWPVVMSTIYSFTNYDGVRAYQFVGFKNYAKLLTNKEFLGSLWNTLYFAVGTVPLGCLLAIFVAVVLNQKIHLKNFYRTCFFMPTVVSMIAVSVVWQLVFNANNGLANSLLGHLGIPPQKWLGSVTQAMPTVIFITVWKGLGTNVVIFLAGLTGVNSALFEAAEIDGAGAWDKFWHVTIPSLRPTITFVLINNSIGSFQALDQIYMLTGGGPAKATQTISYLIYKNAFEYFKQGYASAMAYLLFIVIMIISLAQLRISSNAKN